VTIRRAGRLKQLVDDLKEIKGDWKLKRKVCIALQGKLATKDATDLS